MHELLAPYTATRPWVARPRYRAFWFLKTDPSWNYTLPTVFQYKKG